MMQTEIPHNSYSVVESILPLPRRTILFGLSVTQIVLGGILICVEFVASVTSFRLSGIVIAIPGVPIAVYLIAVGCVGLSASLPDLKYSAWSVRLRAYMIMSIIGIILALAMIVFTIAVVTQLPKSYVVAPGRYFAVCALHPLLLVSFIASVALTALVTCRGGTPRSTVYLVNHVAPGHTQHPANAAAVEGVSSGTVLPEGGRTLAYLAPVLNAEDRVVFNSLPSVPGGTTNFKTQF